MPSFMPTTLAASLLVALVPTAAPSTPEPQLARGLIFAVTSDGGGHGALLRISGGPPWQVDTLATTEGGGHLRQFEKHLYVVNTGEGTIQRVPASGIGAPQLYDLGPTSEPQDIHVPGPQAQLPQLAFVTRRNDPFLLGLNLVTGSAADLVDLSPVGGGSTIALGTLERFDNRLFVQVRVFDDTDAGPGGDSGVLAVVDIPTLQLVDVDPQAPGIQGIALDGAPPHLKMQVVEKKLFVSTTDGFLDGRGGIEIVDLDAFVSIGYALSEQQIADLGGFVMTKPSEGFFVFHTDLLPSTHLEHFTIEAGPDPGPEIIVLLGDTPEPIAYDRRLKRLFLPSGSATPPGIHVIDAVTQVPVGGPIDTGLFPPRDVIVAL